TPSRPSGLSSPAPHSGSWSDGSSRANGCRDPWRGGSPGSGGVGTPCFITGLNQTTAGNSSLLIASTPILTALVGAVLGDERITRAVGWAIAIGTAGVRLV